MGYPLLPLEISGKTLSHISRDQQSVPVSSVHSEMNNEGEIGGGWGLCTLFRA